MVAVYTQRSMLRFVDALTRLVRVHALKRRLRRLHLSSPAGKAFKLSRGRARQEGRLGQSASFYNVPLLTRTGTGRIDDVTSLAVTGFLGEFFKVRYLLQLFVVCVDRCFEFFAVVLKFRYEFGLA